MLNAASIVTGLLQSIACKLLNIPIQRMLQKDWLPALFKSRAETQTDQLSRLKRLLAHAEHHVPYYGDCFRDSGFNAAMMCASSELSKLPFLSKAVIREQAHRMLADTFSASQLMEKSTGGSTGEPLVFYRHAEYLNASQMGTCRNMTLCGWHPGDPVANFWGINDPSLFGRRALKEQIKMGFYTFNAFDVGPHVFGEWLERLERIKPVALYGYASTIWLFCKWMKEHRAKGEALREEQKETKRTKGWDKRLKGVFLTAERLHGFQRELIEEVLGVPVFNLYGSTEIQNIAFECTHGNMHVATDFVVVEVDAPEGETGDFLLTSLHNYAMPFIRYRNGDRGKLLGYVCDCGIEMPCISLDISRSCDNFTTRSGRVIHGEFFTHVMEGITGVQKFQFRQVSLEKVELRVVRAGVVEGGLWTVESVEQAVARVPEIVGDKTGRELDVEVMWVDEIAATSRGKHLFTISEIGECGELTVKS